MTVPPSAGAGGGPDMTSAAPREPAAGPGRRRRGAHRKSRRHRGLKRAIVIVGTVLVLLVAAVVGYNWNLFRQIHTVDVKGLADAGTGAESGSENILMVGSTDRCSLPRSDPLYQDCVNGHTGINSDVIMILHLVAATRQVSVLSIPRDTFVPNARAEGANKIDAALVEGPSQLVAAIEDDFGIPIQHYVELNFASFADVVQAIGGVHMYFPEPVFDQQVGLLIRTPGCVYLNGGDALKLVRSRELQYKGPGVVSSDPYYWTHETQSDLARIARDHEFLRVLATAVAQKGLGNPITDEQLVGSLAPQVEMDSALKSHLLGLASAFHAVNADGVPELTLPIQIPDSTASYFYKGGDYGEVVYPSITDDRGAIERFLGVPATVDTMTGKALPAPASVTVSVLNGTGVANQAAETGLALSALGFKIGTLSDAVSVGTPAETVVTYSAAADEAAAERVAQAFSGMVIMEKAPTSGTSEVTVTTGTDYTVAAPATTAGTTPGTSTSTSTTVAANATAASLAPPSPAVSTLAPWDPRSCTASGGEGR
ncbi:MAG TPA: LCP family protein [Acidimicrobiales bacterium]|jgi:LCP family protein required for cell wall assembly